MTNMEIKEILLKIVKVISEEDIPSVSLKTLDDWCNAAGNHLFDDHYCLFGLTQKEGHKVRAYFQNNSMYPEEMKKDLKSWGINL